MSLNGWAFTKGDKKEIEASGIALEDVMAQIGMFKRGAKFIKLNRPCTIDDGIKVISGDAYEHLTAVYETHTSGKKVTKFVPASGAASRMFKTLLRFNNEYERIQKDALEMKAMEGDEDSRHLLEFFRGLRQFAFFDDLAGAMAEDGLDAAALMQAGRFKEITEYLLTEKGIDYAHLPKGLLPFHRYPDENRTAFEDHLVEAADYIKDRNGVCRLHFTVSPEHREGFLALFKAVRSRYQSRLRVRFEVDFSVQETSTDIIAVDTENNPFRRNDGAIYFRPGGHGALIENLNRLEDDIIYIKNIDNVVPDRLKTDVSFWKKVLGGYLIKTQKKIFAYLDKLAAGGLDENMLKEALTFAETELCITPAQVYKSASPEKIREFLLNRFNRPIRVCGMVKNVGETGGGPFWVEAGEGSLSLRIVESVEIDHESETQQSIRRSSTHFNPVDIVCGVRDRKGNAFDLKRYVDPESVFISSKSKDGCNLKALELPGLWNGGMAHWITIFVEVPQVTFNPVKTVNDLLRKEHR